MRNRMTKALALLHKLPLAATAAVFIIFSATALPAASSRVMAQEDACSEGVLRDKKVAIINCEGKNACAVPGTGTGSTPGPLVGSDNMEKIFNFFLSKGLTAEQAAGIAGNAWAESTGDPGAVSGSGYRGIFQWDRRNRWPSLVSWTQGQGMDPQTLEAQLAFSFHEATERGDIEGMRDQPTVELAAWYWGRFFEGAVISGSRSTTPMTNVQALDKRIGYAYDVLRLYGGSNVSTTNEGVQCGGVAVGDNTQFVDGFPIYSQYDPAWKDLPYSSSTIGVAGCGPAAMAMIITALTGQRVTPVDTANYAAQQGLYVPGQGSSWSIGPVLAAHWNLKSETVARDVTAITRALQEGKLIITPGAGPKPFTRGGHFIVIRGVTASGKFLVGDSGHSDTSDQEWDPQQIVSNMRNGGAYAIYK